MQKQNRVSFTYARAVQFACCCRLDHKILFIELGIIHAIAMQAPKKLNSKSFTVATATPPETTTKAKTCRITRVIDKPLLAVFIQLSVFSKRIRWDFFKGTKVQNGDLLVGNCFPKENELCKNNGRSDCNFSHLIETNTAQELKSKETGLCLL